MNRNKNNEIQDTITDWESLSNEGGQLSLTSAKAYWYFGKWELLTKLDAREFSEDPQRALFALLKASAHQQLDEHEDAEKYTRLALQWGCNNRSVAQVLIAGVHNTLGRAAALTNNDEKMLEHFENAIDVGDKNSDAQLVQHARSVQEMARLGLLPQAAALIDDEIKTNLKHKTSRPNELEAKISVLSTEIENLNHELSVSQKKSQLETNNLTSKPNDSGNSNMSDE